MQIKEEGESDRESRGERGGGRVTRGGEFKGDEGRVQGEGGKY